MEKKLNKAVEDIMNRDGVSGVLCADKNGLCLVSRGTADSTTAGAFVHLARKSLQLEPGRIPVIRLESDVSDVLIQSKQDLTLAIIKGQKR